VDRALRAKRGADQSAPSQHDHIRDCRHADVVDPRGGRNAADSRKDPRGNHRDGPDEPISVPFYFFSDGLGQTLLHAVLVIPSLLCALLLVRIDVPSFPTFAAFLLAFAVGYGVNFFLNFLMNSIAFWTLETFAAQLIVRWASDLLSGQIIPLTLFPGIFGRIVFGLPFAAIYSTPLLIFVGVIRPSEWEASIAAQLAWLVLFAVLSSIVWRAASNRVVIQGG
jgi:ABC-2 type transport system permease protein